MGVYFDKARGKWCARVTDDGHRIFLGRYSSKKGAEAAIKTYEGHKRFFESNTLDNYKLKLEKPRMVKSKWHERLLNESTKKTWSSLWRRLTK